MNHPSNYDMPKKCVAGAKASTLNLVLAQVKTHNDAMFQFDEEWIVPKSYPGRYMRCEQSALLADSSSLEARVSSIRHERTGGSLVKAIAS